MSSNLPVTAAEHRVTCPLCEAMCGLRVTVEDGRVAAIRGNRDDAWSSGHICPKGTALGHLHEDPDRLRAPMVRTAGGGFREVSWAEAYAEVERVLRPVLAEHGARVLTVYIGNPVAHNLGLASFVGALVGMAGAAGMQAYYSPGTVDQWPLNVVSALLFGGMWNAPIPDLKRTDHIVILGANPAVSQASMLSAPDVMGSLADVKRRGGRVIVVDPRRTETAARASEWVPVRPGTDALLLFAVLRTLADTGSIARPPHLAGRVHGLDEAIALSEPFTPERVSEATGIDAPTIRRLAADLAAAQRPVIYSRIGACTQEFGTLTTWLVFVVNVALGSVDRAGGTMFAKPAVWSPMFMKPPDQTSEGWQFGRFHSRVSGAPEVLGQFPLGCLAEEIDTPGEGRIRALISVAGNPVISAPGSRRLDEALPHLDAMICIDNWLNETTRHAHVILPGLSPLDARTPMTCTGCTRWRHASSGPSPCSLPRRTDRGSGNSSCGWPERPGNPGARRGRRVMDDLYVQGLIAAMCATGGTPLSGRDAAAAFAALTGSGPERLVDLGIRLGPWGDDLGRRPGGLTLGEVRRHRDGLWLADLEEGRFDDSVTTPSGCIELIHSHIVDDIPRLVARLVREIPQTVLTSRRHLRSNNSSMHNVPTLMRGKDRCTLLVHPDDAATLGLIDDELATVETSSGTIDVLVHVSDEMMPGVMSLPHGWGHGRSGTRLEVANTHPGVNANLLNPVDVLDVPSNTHVVNGVPCRVRPLC